MGPMPTQPGPLDDVSPDDRTELIDPVSPAADINRPLPSFVPGFGGEDDRTQLVPVVRDEPEPVDATQVMPVVTEELPEASGSTAAVPPAAPPPSPETDDEDEDEDEDPEDVAGRRSSSMMWVAVTVVGFALAAVALALWLFQQLVYSPFDQPTTKTTTAASRPAPATVPTQAAPATSAAEPSLTMTAKDQVWEKGVVAVAPTAIDASCAADGAEPARMFDGDLATAWRCDGDGKGTTITFRIPPQTKIAELGLVNGLAGKTEDGQDGYAALRRITKVTWTLPGGKTVVQDLADGNRDIQRVRPVVTAGDTVVVRIDETTGDGGTDAVAISELIIATPQG